MYYTFTHLHAKLIYISVKWGSFVYAIVCFVYVINHKDADVKYRF